MFKIIITGIAGLAVGVLGIIKEHLHLPEKVYNTTVIILLFVFTLVSIWVGIDTYPKPVIPPKLSLHNEYVRILNGTTVVAKYDTLSNSYILFPTVLNEGPGIAKDVTITFKFWNPPIDSARGHQWSVRKTTKGRWAALHRYKTSLLAQTTKLTYFAATRELTVFVNPTYKERYINHPIGDVAAVKIEGSNIPSTMINFYIKGKIKETDK